MELQAAGITRIQNAETGENYYKYKLTLENHGE